MPYPNPARPNSLRSYATTKERNQPEMVGKVVNSPNISESIMLDTGSVATRKRDLSVFERRIDGGFLK